MPLTFRSLTPFLFRSYQLDEGVKRKLAIPVRLYLDHASFDDVLLTLRCSERSEKLFLFTFSIVSQ